MTTDLLKAVVASGLTENQALDVLQEAGVVSDLYLKLCDVADADCTKAILALSIHDRQKRKGRR